MYNHLFILAGCTDSDWDVQANEDEAVRRGLQPFRHHGAFILPGGKPRLHTYDPGDIYFHCWGKNKALNEFNVYYCILNLKNTFGY